MNPTFKEYALSSIITFVATFCTIVGANLISTTPVELTTSFLVGLLFTGTRAAGKAVIEGLAGKKY
jgi:hypothetical protein